MSLHILTSSVPQLLIPLIPFFGRSGYRRRAFRYIFSATLQKDAAPIPNALGDGNGDFLHIELS